MLHKIFLLSLLFIASCSQQEMETSEPLMVDATALEIREHIESFQGDKPVLVNVWATWCIPCVEEFPYIMQLKQEYGDEFELVFISGDFEEAKDEAKTFLKQQNVDFTTFYKTGNDNDFIESLSAEWSGALPFTIIYSADGKVVTQWEGKASYQEFKSQLMSVIKRS